MRQSRPSKRNPLAQHVRQRSGAGRHGQSTKARRQQDRVRLARQPLE